MSQVSHKHKAFLVSLMIISLIVFCVYLLLIVITNDKDSGSNNIQTIDPSEQQPLFTTEFNPTTDENDLPSSELSVLARQLYLPGEADLARAGLKAIYSDPEAPAADRKIALNTEAEYCLRSAAADCNADIEAAYAEYEIDNTFYTKFIKAAEEGVL